MKIKEMSKKYQISEYTLRYYEKEGLLKGVERDNSGYRIYTKENIEQLENIQCLQKAGLTLKEIKSFLYEFEQKDFKEREKFFLLQKENLEQKLLEIQKALDWTEYKIWYYQHIQDFQLENKATDCESMEQYYQELKSEEE